jgi:predicted secreted protein
MPRRLTRSDDGSVIRLSTGEPVEVRLPQRGGTAFLWHVADAERFRVLHDEVHVGATDAPGADAVRTIVIVPRDRGAMELTLHRYRPWESAQQADDEFGVRLVVGDDGGEDA